MDTTQECRHSVMVDVKDHAKIDERVNEGIGDPVKITVNSATCSEGSSFLQLSEEQLTTGNEGDDGDNNNNEIRVQEVEDNSDDMSEQSTDASVTDNASLGSTNTSSVGTHSASISTDLPTAWFVSMVRFLGLWCLVAGTVSMGMKTKMYALERKEQHLEDEVNTSKFDCLSLKDTNCSPSYCHFYAT